MITGVVKIWCCASAGSCRVFRRVADILPFIWSFHSFVYFCLFIYLFVEAVLSTVRLEFAAGCKHALWRGTEAKFEKCLISRHSWAKPFGTWAMLQTCLGGEKLVVELRHLLVPRLRSYTVTHLLHALWHTCCWHSLCRESCTCPNWPVRSSCSYYMLKDRWNTANTSSQLWTHPRRHPSTQICPL